MRHRILTLALSCALLLAGAPFAGAEAPPYEWRALDEGTVEITKYTGVEAVVAVPETLDGRSVTSVGSGAFRNCATLKEAALPSTVTKIGDCAFSSCARLERIILPENLTDMGECAFEGCSSLREAILPGSLEEVPFRAFSGCESLEKVALSEGIRILNWDCFADCVALEEIALPASLVGLYDNPFAGCTALRRVSIAEGNDSLLFENGALLNLVMEVGYDDSVSPVRELACWLPALGGEEYEVSGDVKRIGYGAFQRCSALKRVILPAELKEIGAYAFFECASLEEIRMPKELDSIGEGAFFGCAALRSLDLTGYSGPVDDDPFDDAFDMDLVLILLPDSELEESALNCGYAYRYPDDDETTKRGNLEVDDDEYAD